MWLYSIGTILLIQGVAFSKALYEGCDHVYNLAADSVAYLESPYYPNKYPSSTSCRYQFVAPLDYEILAECTIAIDKNPNACSTEYFYVARDGDPNLTGADQFCGSGSVTRTSLFRTIVMTYTSRAAPNSGIGGKFQCKLTTRPQACDCGWSQNKRIIGGVETSINEFPSMVGLYHIPSQTVFCGGTIIDHRTIVTAAHCTRLYSNPKDVLVLAGDHDLSSSTETRYARAYSVYKYIENSGYVPSTDVNDIALIITAANIEWSRGVGPICLPLSQPSNVFTYKNVDVLGWGTTSFAGARATALQKASVSIIANADCQRIYPSLVSSQMCTYGQNRDACQFDSGGPVVYKDTVRQFLLGTISYGFACGTEPGVNTRTTSFLNWIQSNAAGKQCYKPLTN